MAKRRKRRPKYKRQISRRGGAVRIRTLKLPGGKFLRIHVTRKRGPRGGRTVAGPVRKKKRRR